MRFAVIYNISGTIANVEAYLPENYKVIPQTLTTTPDGKRRIAIQGEDVAGWTLDGYVLPRLASALLFATEMPSYEAAYDSTVGVMN